MASDNFTSIASNDWPEAAEYFASFSDGRWDEAGKYGFIYSRQQARISKDGERLYIGRAGVDGIEFVFRRGSPGIWAYYPIDGDYMLKADTMTSFEEGWRAGEITV